MKKWIKITIIIILVISIWIAFEINRIKQERFKNLGSSVETITDVARDMYNSTSSTPRSDFKLLKSWEKMLDERESRGDELGWRDDIRIGNDEWAFYQKVEFARFYILSAKQQLAATQIKYDGYQVNPELVKTYIQNWEIAYDKGELESLTIEDLIEAAQR